MQEMLEAAKSLLTSRSSSLLAIAVAFLVTAAILLFVTHLDPTTFEKAAQDYAPLLLIIGLISFVFAGFKRYTEQTTKTVQISPSGECWAHIAVQPDGRRTTQLSCDVYVFSITDGTVWLPRIEMEKPKTNARYLNKMFLVKQQGSRLYGAYEIPPGSKTKGSAHIIVDADISKKLSRGGVVLRIADQHNHWHVLKFTHVQIR